MVILYTKTVYQTINVWDGKDRAQGIQRQSSASLYKSKKILADSNA